MYMYWCTCVHVHVRCLQSGPGSYHVFYYLLLGADASLKRQVETTSNEPEPLSDTGIVMMIVYIHVHVYMYSQELMSCPKGGKERPTPHYSVERHLTDCDTDFPYMDRFSSRKHPVWSRCKCCYTQRCTSCVCVVCRSKNSTVCATGLVQWLPTRKKAE